MIKIEKLIDSAKAVFTRNGTETPVFAGQLLGHNEIGTLKVLSGSVLYSVDETELVTVKAGEQAASVEETTKSTESTPTVEPTVEVAEKTEEVVTTPVAPVIVKPAPRAKK